MPRRPRIELAGGLHHVTARTIPGRSMFVGDADRHSYLEHVRDCADARAWSVLSYCLMSNHVHLLVRTTEPNLGDGMKCLHELLAMRLNHRESRSGHVFGGRFHNSIVTTDRYAQGCLRYIARNPVKAGLCASAEQWRWSAHRALAGLEPPSPVLDVEQALSFFGEEVAAARRSYVRAVETPDGALVRALEQQHGARGLAHAVEAYGVEPAQIAAAFGWSPRTTRRRLNEARAAAAAGE